MTIWNRIFSFYVNSSIHVAFAVICLSLVSFWELNITIDYTLLIFIFLATITGYNFVKYAGVAKLHHRSLAPFLKTIQVFSLICFALLIYYIFQQKFQTLVLCFFLGALTILYAIPVFSGNRNLRGFTGIKIFIIAFVWAGVTVLLPALEQYSFTATTVIISFIQRFLFVIAITLPFEIRDLRFDMANLGTIPQILGTRKTRYLGIFLMITVVLMDFFKKDNSSAEVLSIIVTAILGSYLIAKAGIRQKPYYSSFWVEAIPIFWFALLVLFSLILS